MSLLDVDRVLFVHAHPDDETIATGALILELVRRGVEVSLLTATRGEQGEVMPGGLEHLAGTPELVRHRVGELEDAVRVLGVARLMWLGTPPARAAGRDPRAYRDSGMKWVSPGVAGPSDERLPHTFTSAAFSEVTADVAAAIEAASPGLVIGYDENGGYGHPDHVRAREAALAACRARGVPFAEVLTEPVDGAEELELDRHADALRRALRCHASQIALDGDEIVHVGGQRTPIVTAVGLRAV